MGSNIDEIDRGENLMSHSYGTLVAVAVFSKLSQSTLSLLKKACRRTHCEAHSAVGTGILAALAFLLLKR